MKLSLNAIEICKNKFGKGELRGFDLSGGADKNEMSRSAAYAVFDELDEAGMLVMADGELHISALGQHILNMMLTPELFLVLDSGLKEVCVRVYIRDAYYLCVLENKAITSDTNAERFTLELVPGFEQVVGAFVYALYKKDSGSSAEHSAEESRSSAQDDGSNAEDGNNSAQDSAAPEEEAETPEPQTAEFRITGTDGKVSLDISGTTDGKAYRFCMSDADNNITECDVCAMVNTVTEWMFDRLSVMLADKEKNDGTD